MSILVVAENSNKEIKSSTLNSINAASKINEDIHLVSYNSNNSVNL